MTLSYYSGFCKRVYALAVEVGAIKPGQVKEQPGDLGAVATFVAVIKATTSAQGQMLLCSATRNDLKNEK